MRIEYKSSVHARSPVDRKRELMVATSRTSLLAAAGGLAGAAAVAYGLLVRGRLTIDVDIGRSLRPLGPLTLRIDAPRDVVFDVISAPYLGRTPRALERKLRVLERGADLRELPDELHVELKRFPRRHVEAYWNGCAWLV